MDGYKIPSEKRPPISWTPFSSDSWRTRLKRVKQSLKSNSTGEASESSCSGVLLRYTPVYPCRCWDTADAEFLPKIEPVVLLDIAGSSAQAFKDIEAALKKRDGKKGQSVSSPGNIGHSCSSEGSELRMEKWSSVNIKGWSEDRIKSHFCLNDFTIDISDFPHHELPSSTSLEFVGDGAARKLSSDELKYDEEYSQSNKNEESVAGVEHKKKKRKRSASSSSARTSTSSDGGENHLDSGNEASAATKNTTKKKAYSERPCVECGRYLDTCVMDWKETLGMSTVWCSRECIERRVARAYEVLPEGYGALTLLRSDGHVLTHGPELENLAEFILKYPDYEPVLPLAKRKKVARNDQGSDTKKSTPRLLSKDADRIRFNVKRAFSDALLKRAKMDKVKSAMKLCKDVSENIEAALFKHCGSNLNSTSYKSWTKSFIENVADCRNKSFYYRVLTGMISVCKVVTLDGNDMKKPEYSSPLDEAPANSVVEHRDDAPVSCEQDKTDQSVSTRGTIKKDGVSATTTKASTNSTKKTETKQTERVAQRSNARKSVSASASSSTLEAILGDGAKDTTEQHLSHFYDVNCSICLAKQKSQAEAERERKGRKGTATRRRQKV
ncbi:hypothetical protein KIN20_029347 [Parelaphostrongylus tenuis]|uniref:TFIIS central domain-containing protein n=1 Tax=Parelaphostrongylus tenuis TaxID=148309 RepID=A0AAD5WFJ9_PARTN|nr:hypothetical protein KIN20_029347 [Parelaphostrongylus tenuis]